MGMPYSAGFFSKEFLLFQVLRDGFLSFVIRSCWVISFFCTPFYMLKLTFLALYGPAKKVSTVIKIIKANNVNLFQNINFTKAIIQFFQHSLVLSRFTLILLSSFWVLLCFYGETIFLIYFNFISFAESITGLNFFEVKTNFSYLSTNESYLTLDVLTFFVYTITSNSALLLLSYKYPSSTYGTKKIKNWNSFFLVIFVFII